MTIISVYVSYPLASVIHRRLDEIANRVPCIVRYFSTTGEIFIQCRVEDAAFCERMIADFV